MAKFNKYNKKSNKRFYSKRDIQRKTNKNLQTKEYQSSIFDFLGPDENLDNHVKMPLPTRVDVVTAKSFLTKDSFTVLLDNSDYLNKPFVSLADLEIPIYEFASEKGRKYTKVANPNLYSDDRPVFISTDLFVKVISKGKIINYRPFDGRDDIFLANVDGKIDCYSVISLAMEAFLGFYPEISPSLGLRYEPNWDDFDSIENLDFSGAFLRDNPVVLSKALLDLSKVREEVTVEPKVEQPKVEEKEEDDVPSSSWEDDSSNLIPINVDGIKPGYFYDPENRRVVTHKNSSLLIDNHHLRSRGIVYLELDESYGDMISFGAVSLAEIHDVCYLGKTLLPSLHYTENGEVKTHKSYITPPVQLTDEMKQFIKENRYMSLKNTRILAEKVYGKDHYITPLHTKEVKKYRESLLNEK